MARLSIRLLGPLQVTLDGEPVTGFESDKVRALLVYLAVEQAAPQRREKLAGLLWPDWPERSARTNLRRALANLRRAIGDHQAMPPFLYISHQTIQFNRASDAWVDVTDCQDLLSVCPPRSTRTSISMTAPQNIRQMEEAVALYRGDFLEGFSLAGCPAFEEWMLFEEERLRRLTLEALDHLSGWYEQRGETKHALQHARRQVELDPLRESAHRQIMRLLARNGQRGVALAQYETCRLVLADELGVQPGVEMRQLYEQIRDGEWERSAVAPAPIPEPELTALPPSFLAEETVEVVPSLFVARERELARLEGFLDRALAGDGKVVFVTGGAGRGKTALLNEFARRAMETHAGLLVTSGNCNAYSGVGDPYLPFRDVMGLLTGDVEARWTAGAISRAHALRLWQALPITVEALLAHGPHVVPALVPSPALLSRARAAAPAGAPWLQRLHERVERGAAHPEGLEQSHLFQQITHVLRALAEVHPLLLILDDLQWTDSASAGLLFHLGRRLQGTRILVTGAYRPEEVAPGRAGERHPLETMLAEFKRAFGDVWLDLAEVPEPEGRHFVDAILETEPNHLGEDFRRALFERTGGHPLFTLELLRAMQERGDLVQDESGCWVEGPALDWDMLPARVEGVIEARIGRLEGELRVLLSVACVEGEEFTAQVVARVQEVSQRQALRWLSQELEVRHRLVREQSTLRLGRRRLSRYRFAHALFQQYLYHHLGDGERALLHGEVAGALEELYQDRQEEVAVPLARHYSEAGDEERALKYLKLTADGSLAVYANSEAETRYRRALELAPGRSEQARMLSGLGEALFRQSRFQEAIQTWGQGIEQYRALQDSDGVALLYASSARAAGEANNPAEALRLCWEGLAEVQEEAGPGLARLYHETARACASNALREQARPYAQRALEMAERLGDVEVQAQALASPALLGLPSVEDEWQALLRAVELAESHSLLDVASLAHSSLATLDQRHRGDYCAAREHLRRAAELCGQAGDTAGEVLALREQAFNSAFVGGLEEAKQILWQARALLRDLAEPTYAAQALLRLEGVFLLVEGRWAECARHQWALQAAARERGDDFELAHAAGLLAWAVLEADLAAGDASVGTLEEIEATLHEAIAIWDRSFNIHGSIHNRVILAQLRLAQGRAGEARHLLAEARQMAMEDLALPEDHGFLHWMEGQASCGKGRWAEAMAAHEAAHEVCARYGLRWHWARFRLDWAEAHVARGEPGDRKRAQELLREAQAVFEEVGTPRYAAVARDRLQELRAAEGAAMG